jgi:hypothetical protein
MARGKAHYGVAVLDLIGAGILNPGDEATFEPRSGEEYRGQVEANGDLTLDGRRFNTPSDAATTLAGNSRNGWKEVKVNGRPLDEYRKQLGGPKPPAVPPPPPHAQAPPAAPAPQPASYASVAGARSELYALTERVRSLIAGGEGRRLSEADTRALFIDPYLRLLGYVGFEDVRREYFVKDLKEYMDYLLYVDGAPTIALEAKALGADLTDPMAAQLVKYAAIEGIEWCLLTNARQFFVYNQYLKGTVCDKLVLRLDVLAGQTQDDLDATLGRLWLLSKDNMRQGGLTAHVAQFKLDRAIREILLEPGNAAVRSIRAELRRRFSLQASQDAIAAWVREHLSGL